MDGFKKLPKLQCFKEGGYVTAKPKSVVEKTTKVAPTGNKKANAKSAAVVPKEKEEKIEFAKFKKGGRVKKAIGTVKKFIKPAAAPSKAAVKAKGKVKETKKSGDKDKIKKVADTSKKAAAPSKAATKGKAIKKFADGGLTSAMTPPPVTPPPALNQDQKQNLSNSLNNASMYEPSYPINPADRYPNTPPDLETPYVNPWTLAGPLGPNDEPLNQPPLKGPLSGYNTQLPPDLATPLPRADGTYGPVGQKPKPSIYQQVTSGPSNGEEFGIPAPRMPTSTPPQVPMFQPRPTPTPQMRPATAPRPDTGPPLPGPGGTSQPMGNNFFGSRNQIATPPQTILKPTPNPINKLMAPIAPLPGRRFKKGGHVESEEMGKDLAQDKKLIKKAFKQHDKAEHNKAPTEIKLRKGGRAEKDCGTIRKYKCGGGVYGAKKTEADIKNIDDAKDCTPKKLKTGGTAS
jgi:hypothetical protein